MDDVVQGTLQTGRRFWLVAGVLAALFLAGVGGFAFRAQDGFDDRLPWGYYAAAFSFLLTAAGAAPIVSIALRMAKGHWRRPFARASELYAVVGILTLLMFMPLLALLPPLEGRNTLWFDWPEKTPQIYDSLAVAFLVICGLAFLYVAALPDFGMFRERATGRLQRLFVKLASFWQGNRRQWKFHAAALSLLGALYFLLFVFVQSMVSTDYSMSLVPGWRDSIFPPFQALAGLQAAVGLMLVTMFILRWAGGYERYFDVEQFWGLAKVLLPLSLMFAYFWWAGFITYWYGRSPTERNILELLMFGPYRALFSLVLILNFAIPLTFLIWNSIRKSILGPTIVGASVVVGSLVDRIRLYVAPFSIADSRGNELEHVPATHYPDAADVLMIIGAIAGAILIYLLATRVVPVMSVWEMKELHLLRKVRPFMGREVVVLGKPE